MSELFCVAVGIRETISTQHVMFERTKNLSEVQFKADVDLFNR